MGLVKEPSRNWHIFVKIKVWQGCYPVIWIRILDIAKDPKT